MSDLKEMSGDSYLPAAARHVGRKPNYGNVTNYIAKVWYHYGVMATDVFRTQTTVQSRIHQLVVNGSVSDRVLGGYKWDFGVDVDGDVLVIVDGYKAANYKEDQNRVLHFLQGYLPSFRSPAESGQQLTNDEGGMQVEYFQPTPIAATEKSIAMFGGPNILVLRFHLPSNSRLVTAAAGVINTALTEQDYWDAIRDLNQRTLQLSTVLKDMSPWLLIEDVCTVICGYVGLRHVWTQQGACRIASVPATLDEIADSFSVPRIHPPFRCAVVTKSYGSSNNQPCNCEMRYVLNQLHQSIEWQPQNRYKSCVVCDDVGRQLVAQLENKRKKRLQQLLVYEQIVLQSRDSKACNCYRSSKGVASGSSR